MSSKDLDPAAHSVEEEDILLEKKRARKIRRKKMNSGPSETEMNLTALMDVLTIMLVFLLKNYTTSPALNLNANLSPPESTADLDLDEAITVSITRNDISVDDEKVLDLENGKIPESFRVKEEPLMVPRLKDSLTKRVDHHKRIADLTSVAFEGNMLVVGDRSVDYELLSQVLYTAGQAQLGNFKFVTISY